MAHILEWIKSDSLFNASDIICEKITDLMVRMYDFNALVADDAQKEVIESWRKELTFIRIAVDKVFVAGLPLKSIAFTEPKKEKDNDNSD